MKSPLVEIAQAPQFTIFKKADWKIIKYVQTFMFTSKKYKSKYQLNKKEIRIQ